MNWKRGRGTLEHARQPEGIREGAGRGRDRAAGERGRRSGSRGKGLRVCGRRLPAGVRRVPTPVIRIPRYFDFSPAVPQNPRGYRNGVSRQGSVSSLGNDRPFPSCLYN
ncbi:unnamed protein product [Coccothraustes coccothraustes]